MRAPQAASEPMPVVLFVYDAPNVIKTIESLLGRMPKNSEMPRLTRVAQAIRQLAEPSGALVDLRVYVNRHLRDSNRKKHWIEKDLPRMGYKVLTEVKRFEDDPRDVDEDMVWLIKQRLDNPQISVVEIIVASNDTACFRNVLNRIARTHPGVVLKLVGFEEMYFRRWYDKFEFLDWRDIEGVFQDPLPRLTKANLNLSRTHPPKTVQLAPTLATSTIQTEQTEALVGASERGEQFDKSGSGSSPWKKARR